ncbi:hypothetical protein IEQ34_014566 [Dendrobium chrysotoxum]|uniref:Uncharacterized protein n=1 Tax=Dendrobium chrysotoxum TaxID=161865 RepID=A0AAV7G480_DENCH|nr:hypothetical protein IEQ34_014566 [Dendrobium chrysotoxum]
MEEFPHFYVQCKSIGHLPGEYCSSIPVTDSVNHNIFGEKVNAMVENVVVVGPVKNSLPNVTHVYPIEVVVNGEIGVDGALAVENSNVAPSSGINEGVTKVYELNPCSVNLVASPNISPDSNVVVGDGEVAIFDYFDPLYPGDRQIVSHVGRLLPLESGEVALDSPARFSASFSDGGEPEAKNVDVPISIISNDVLLAHLSCNLRDHEVIHGDWLNDDNSSTGGEETNEND